MGGVGGDVGKCVGVCICPVGICPVGICPGVFVLESLQRCLVHSESRGSTLSAA